MDVNQSKQGQVFDLNQFTRNQLSYLFKKIFDCNGNLYGGFVRNCVIQNFINHDYFDIFNDPIYKFKDIDVWFQSEHDLENLLNFFHDHNEIKELISKSAMNSGGDLYEFNVHKFYFVNNKFKPTKKSKSEDFYNKKQGLSFEFIVSNKCPVNDFYINTLIITQMDCCSITLCAKNDLFDEKSLVEQINNKVIDIMPSYFDKLLNNLSYKHTGRLAFRYLGRGWSVKHKNKIINSLPKEIIKKFDYKLGFDTLISSFKNDEKENFEIVYRNYVDNLKIDHEHLCVNLNNVVNFFIQNYKIQQLNSSNFSLGNISVNNIEYDVSLTIKKKY